MLPLRLCLEGFLSYRDRTEFDFSSSRLWMLCGPNGAGKSSVFDALRFVIYGAHRAGKQNAEMLVHHESARLRVEADLQLGENVFRLVRTLGRNGARPTWQVRQKIEGQWRDVPETAIKTDYERWIAAHIGLSDEAFCAAVYLSQGHADAILNPDPQARLDLLSQLVDLRAYEGWHERAEERRLGARAAFQDARRRWQGAPHPDAPELELKREEARFLARERDALSERERELEALQSDAARFETWKNALETLTRSAATKRVLLQDEAAIERDFARLSYRERHLPTLEEWLRLATRGAELELELATSRAGQSEAKRAFDEAGSARARALEELEQARNAGQKAGESLNALELEGARLAPGEAELARRQSLRDELNEAASQLAALHAPASEVERLLGERDAARDLARVLPSWRRFVAARRTAREEDALWQAATLGAAELSAQLAQSAGGDEAARVQQSQSGLEAAQARQTRAQARLDAAQNARRDFARVEGEARCHFCGQELSPEHARLEAGRLEGELALSFDEHERRLAGASAAQSARTQAQNRLENAQKAGARLERAISKSRVEVALHLQKRDDALALARLSWDELADVRASVWPQDSFDFAFDSARPDKGELARWEEEAARWPEREGALSRAQEREREQARLERERERLERDLSPLDAKWSAAATTRWRARWNALDAERSAVRNAHEKANANLRFWGKTASERATLLETARVRHEELAGLIGPLEGEERALTRQIETSWLPVQAAIQSAAIATGTDAVEAQQNASRDEHPATAPNVATAPNATVGANEERVSVLNNHAAQRIKNVRETAKAWRSEWRALQEQHTGARHGELAQARVELERLNAEIAFFTRAVGELPEAARRLPGELLEELSSTRAQAESLGSQAQAAERGVARWEDELEARAGLESAMQARELEHDRWSKLAELLGPRQLQRYLLREAERGIVREANAVLEAISGGALRLELRAESDEGSATPKVLDVQCHHLSGSAHSRPVSPAFLSGSQRFRVAVALALGIGRTAARGGGNPHSAARVEAILIDEGFGSLDKVGRDEMKDELRVLGRELGRIILVSHQEDFAQGFPARFDISMEDGVSRAQRVVE